MNNPRRRPPADPMVRALIQQARGAAAARRASTGSAGLSRRQFLTVGAGVAGTAALLAACGTGGAPGASSSALPSPATDVSDAEKLVRWANWTLYLDQNDAGTEYPTLNAFTKQTGIEVEYLEDIEDNDTFYGKVSGQLANGDDIGYDIVTPTDWMAGRMIRLGYAQELDLDNIPNAANLVSTLRDVDYDEGRKHALTWQSGFGGLAWDKAKVPGGMQSLDDLWKPELAGKVEVLSEMHDTIGLIMLSQGVDPAGDWGDAEYDAAIELLREKITSGHIRQVKGNSYTQDLVSGDCWACIGWSGDITALNYEADNRFDFVVPEAGGTLWSDEMLIPVGATHKKNAETLMNYYYEPEVAAEVAAWVNYVTPVDGAREVMEQSDPELAADTNIFPDDETLAKVHVFRTLTPAEETKYNGQYLEVIGA